MMKPEPSDRLSGRGPCCGPCCGPGWRGMKRRKNSCTSSSSTPGICGTAATRRAACVVLIFTTAAPWSSTSLTKSGRSRCASAAPANSSASSATCALSQFILVPPLLWLSEFDPGGNALHTGGGRLAHHRHDVVRHLPRVDLESAEARRAGLHGRAASRQRFYEHRHRGNAVGIHHLAGWPRLAQGARHLDDLAKAR